MRRKGYLYSQLNKDVVAKLQSLKLPAGYTWKAAGKQRISNGRFQDSGQSFCLLYLLL